MIYPKHTDSPEVWSSWVEQVAPLRGPVAQDLHPDLRFLSRISDRELAAISAKGLVTALRERKQLDPTTADAPRYEQRNLYE